MPPLVSVLLPVYNRASSVARAIESVLAQTYAPVELIVIDDGSTDGTRDVLARYASRMTILEQNHGGAYRARNTGIQHSTGELIAFIDSDDAWLPEKLARQVPLFERDEVGLVFGNARVLTPSGPTEKTMFDITPPKRGRAAAHLVWGNFVPTVTAVARRSALAPFAVEPSLSADYLAWFRIAVHHEIDFADDVVAEYTFHPGGMSHDLGRSLEARIQLFSRELESTTDPATRAILRRLLFHLSIHLFVAAVRGRARSVERPVRLARTVASRTGTAGWTAAFVFHHALARVRRLFS
jgi:glycosyltransferase involved in cell wall biosynthesis